MMSSGFHEKKNLAPCFLTSMHQKCEILRQVTIKWQGTCLIEKHALCCYHFKSISYIWLHVQQSTE